MERNLVKLITRATHTGTTFAPVDGHVELAGARPPDELLTALREHRDAITALLTSPHCAACDTPTWINEADTGIPWCRPCATKRGLQLLRHEHPDLIEELTCAN